MALIETRWLTPKSENAISLAGETWLRRLPFGRSWTKIRFGCLATLQGGFIEQTTAATAIGDLKFLLGISSSDAWDTGMLSAQSGVGVSVTGTPVIGTAAGLAAASAFPTQCWIGGASPFAFTFRTEGHEGLGQVRTATTFAGTAAYIYPDGNTDGAKRRGIYVVDITRNQGGSGSCTVDFYYVISGGAGGTTFAATPSDLMDLVTTQNTTNTINGVTVTRVTLATIVVPEYSAGLDTLFIHNSHDGYPLMVYAVAACVFNDQPYSSTGGSLWDIDDLTAIAPNGTAIPVAGTDLTSGYGWSTSSWTLTGTSNGVAGIGYAGTATGMPFEYLQLYNTSPVTDGGTISSGVYNQGTGWTEPFYLIGTSANRPQNELAGTSAGWPLDTFEQYFVGAVTSGVTINAGTGWAAAAVIN